ncbi:MAG TPA: winged helix-turn-helix domain-containing protein [Kofleriaceae bacterium]|nr:winged helix-turn-helix domain-containing protein [Kofleriaceae bacterium]
MESSTSGASSLHGPGAPEPCARAILALELAARGEHRQADALILEIERTARGPGHAADLALAHLARATLLALDGEAARAEAEVRRALLVATRERVDPELVIAALRGLGDVIVIHGSGRRAVMAADALAVPGDAVVIDARADTLTVRGATRSLRRYPVRRRLLYALARRPGTLLGKEALVEAVWEQAYDPMRHDDLIKATVLHLRRVLAGTGVAITCGHPGYRLDAAVPLLLLAPFTLRDARPSDP